MRIRYYLCCLCAVLTLPFCWGCNDPASPKSAGGFHLSLIGYYPLDSTPNDTLGKLDPMVLENTPYLEGGIYCNGQYTTSGGTMRSLASTPTLDSLNFAAFTISAQFKVKEIVSPPVNGRAVFMGGRVDRWMGVILRPDTTLSLWYNNGSYIHTAFKIPMDTWQEVGISYDSASQTGKLFLNGVMIASGTFALQQIGGRDISTSNFAVGTAFLGYLRDLKIYKSSSIY